MITLRDGSSEPADLVSRIKDRNYIGSANPDTHPPEKVAWANFKSILESTRKRYAAKHDDEWARDRAELDRAGRMHDGLSDWGESAEKYYVMMQKARDDGLCVAIMDIILSMVPEVFAQKRLELVDYQTAAYVKKAKRAFSSGYGVDRHIQDCRKHLQKHYPHPW